MPPLLALKGISKRFGAVQALDGVDFELRAGEVHALLGENGAGKSTLLNLLAGVHIPSAGTLHVQGEPQHFGSPRDALAAGIAMIHQELRLVPELSLAENFWLGRWPQRGQRRASQSDSNLAPNGAAPTGWLSRLTRPFRRLDRRHMQRHAAACLRALGCDVDVRQRAGSVGAATGQLLSIARALDLDARVLLMDEPTSSLDDAEVARLFEVLRKLTAKGIGIVFVSHFLQRVRIIADRVTVLRDGKHIATREQAGLSRSELVELMLGKELLAAAPPSDLSDLSDPSDPSTANAARAEPRQRPLLRARIAAQAALRTPHELELRIAEVCGLAGLLGAGRSELARALFGAFPGERVELEIDGQRRPLRSARQAIALGFAFCPEDRRRDGLFPGLDLTSNLTLIERDGFWLSPRRSAGRARRIAERLSLRFASLRQHASQLSGGNQQKLVLGRWLDLQPRVYVLDEPTRGIDVGARAEIEQWITEEAARGASILFVASEIEELARRCDRVLILVEGEVVAELSGGEVDEQQLVQAIGRGGSSQALQAETASQPAQGGDA
jgi:monosaccharide-transporting ATPase